KPEVGHQNQSAIKRQRNAVGVAAISGFVAGLRLVRRAGKRSIDAAIRTQRIETDRLIGSAILVAVVGNAEPVTRQQRHMAAGATTGGLPVEVGQSTGGPVDAVRADRTLEP